MRLTIDWSNSNSDTAPATVNKVVWLYDHCAQMHGKVAAQTCSHDARKPGDRPDNNAAMNCGGQVMTIVYSCALYLNPIARREQEMFQYALLLSDDLNPDSGQAHFFAERNSNVPAFIQLWIPLGATQ